MARELPPGYSEAAPSRELPEGYSLVEEMRDAPADFQPSGQEPTSNPSFEVAGRYNTQGATPSYAPPPSPGGASGFSPTRALLTNEPTQGFAEDVVRGIPATVGGLAGTLAGAGVASIPGAALGGMGGEGIRQSAVGLYATAQGKDAPTAGQVMTNMGIQGAMQGGGQAVGLGIGAAAKAARPIVNKLGAQVMRVGAGIPEKAGEMAMRNPSVLLDAPSKAAAKAGYTTFEANTGLKGLDELAGARAKPWSAGELYEFALQTANKIKSGAQIPPQELYTASQAQNQLSRLAKFGNPDAAAMLGSNSLQEAGQLADDALQLVHPEYAGLRTNYAQAKTAGEFSSWLPLNKNQSPNVLRSALAGREAVAGAVALGGIGTGNPVGLAALPLISPRFYGTVLKGAALAGKVPTAIYRVGMQAGAGAGGSALADAYMRQPQGAR